VINPLHLLARKRALGLLLLAITSGILVAGLWPFNFRPENKVRWLKDQNGVQFYGRAIIVTQLPAPFPLYPCSVELCLQSTIDESSHIGHIFSFLDEHGSETFFIGQWKSHLLLGKGIHGKKGYNEIGIRDVLKRGDRRFVTITSGVDGANIYVDGILLKSSPRFHLFSMNDKPSGKILLGNSPKGSEYWTGNLLSLSIYNRALTGEEVSRHPQSEGSKEGGVIGRYLFDEHSGTLVHDSVGNNHLVIPREFEVLKKTVLVPPWEDFRFTRSYLMDILTNILGFIPFGFFISAYLRMKKPRSNLGLLLLSVIIAGCISLSIELIQVYLPSRSSQLTDVITNMLGAALGTYLTRSLMPHA
jgi:VanZ family protein